MIGKLRYALTHSRDNCILRYSKTLGVNYDKNTLRKNMKKALFKYGLCYEEYMLYGLYDKPQNACKDYIGEIERYKYYKKYNSPKEKKLLRNKALQREYFKGFYYGDWIYIDKNTLFEDFFAFVEKHAKVIIKPKNKSCGYGIEMLEKCDRAVLEQHFLRLKRAHKAFLCEKYTVQSPQTSQFNPTSLNTVRFIQPSSCVSHFAFTPFFRMGRYGSVVDNAGAGGIFASVDLKSGTIITAGRDENGFFYPYHPDSKVKIKGFQLPDWEGAINLVEALQSKVESRLISWDIAYSYTKGWVLVEANYAGQLVCQQSCLGEVF